MIDKNSLDINWIKKVSKNNRNADKILVEKAIRALLLLEGLVKTQFDFIFKGGSALMLMSDSPKRFSIDIDVIMEKEPQDIEKKFQKIIKDQHFTGFKQQHRSLNSKIRKAHYHELENGIQRLTNYVFSESFHLEKAIPLASIAAYIASVIKYDQERIDIFKDPLQMDKWNIDNTLWPRVNRLKKSNPEAFFYWYKIHELGQI